MHVADDDKQERPENSLIQINWLQMDFQPNHFIILKFHTLIYSVPIML